MSKPVAIGVTLALALLSPAPVQAQLNGSHVTGDFGVQAGSQPLPGFYASLFFVKYDTDTLKGRNGNTLTLAPGSPGSIGTTALAPILWYVSNVKLFGANYGVMAVPAWANASLEAPAFGFGQTISTGVADMLIRPLDLGWHTSRADVSAGFQFSAPTGRYAPGADDNLGKGMWSYEPFVGTTVFLDPARTFSLATTAFWELHSTKRDSNVKVGQLLTLEGGVGKSFLGGGLIIGGAYYAQWKLTEDQLGSFMLPGGDPFDPSLAGRHRVFGAGPDITLPIATRSKLISLVNVRYFWESGARSKTQGQNLVVTATFPIPSVPLR